MAGGWQCWRRLHHANTPWSVSRELTAFYELYGFCFQGHHRGGGCFPSSLLGLSGICCPSSSLPLKEWGEGQGETVT